MNPIATFLNWFASLFAPAGYDEYVGSGGTVVYQSEQSKYASHVPVIPNTDTGNGGDSDTLKNVAAEVKAGAAIVSVGASAASAVGLTGSTAATATAAAEVGTTGAAAGATATAEAGAAAGGASAASIAAAPIAIAAFIVWNAGEMLFGGPDFGTEVPPPWATNTGVPIDPTMYNAASYAENQGNSPRFDGSRGGWVYLPVSQLRRGVESNVGGIKRVTFENGVVLENSIANPKYPELATPIPPYAIYVPLAPEYQNNGNDGSYGVNYEWIDEGSNNGHWQQVAVASPWGSFDGGGGG